MTIRLLRKKLESYPQKENLSYDLHFLYGIRKRVQLEGNGPRLLYIRGNELLVPTYFADVLNKVDINTLSVISVNMNPK